MVDSKSLGTPKLSERRIDISKRSDRKPWRWTPTNIARADDISSIISELQDYLPLTERQVYYRLISSPCFSNEYWGKHGKRSKHGENKSTYDTLTPLMKWMRIDGKLEWGAIVDENRVLTTKAGFSDAKQFARDQLDQLFRGYSRCIAQDQPYFIEVWIEKQALLRIAEPIADKFCRRVRCCRGYSSVSFLYDYVVKATDALNQGMTPLILYFGDWDPSGVDMIHAALQSIESELGLPEGVEVIRCGINPEHFDMIDAAPVPIKPTDRRHKGFIKDHGETCYELDAFHPVQLEYLIEQAILKYTDTEAVYCNYNVEEKELKELHSIKLELIDYIGKSALLTEAI